MNVGVSFLEQEPDMAVAGVGKAAAGMVAAKTTFRDRDSGDFIHLAVALPVGTPGEAQDAAVQEALALAKKMVAGHYFGAQPLEAVNGGAMEVQPVQPNVQARLERYEQRAAAPSGPRGGGFGGGGAATVPFDMTDRQTGDVIWPKGTPLRELAEGGDWYRLRYLANSARKEDTKQAAAALLAQHGQAVA